MIRNIILVFLLLFIVKAQSQIIVDNTTPFDNPQFLVDDILLGGGVVHAPTEEPPAAPAVPPSDGIAPALDRLAAAISRAAAVVSIGLLAAALLTRRR